VTVHVISVGRSVLDALAEPAARRPDGSSKYSIERSVVTAIGHAKPHELLTSSGAASRDEASDWLAAAFDRGDPGNGDRADLEAMTADIRPGGWPPNMSAEIETFSRVRGPGPGRRPGGPLLSSADMAVLVCSDTADGLLAGAWNALALVSGDLNRVRYVPDAADKDARLGELSGQAVIVRVTGLDASSQPGFRDAMSGLGELARHLFASGSLHQAEEFRFYLSGGFKATIPYLIGLAEAIRSVDAECLDQPELMPGDASPWPVRAFMLHEAAPAGALPIELPLRHLVADVVREELTEWEGDRRQGIPGYGLLAGYAYEVHQGPEGREPCVLTPFGAGLRSLFGLSREGHGG
jgi:hypothetical protein